MPWGILWEITRYVNTGFELPRFEIEELNRLTRLENTLGAPQVTKYVERARGEPADKAPTPVDEPEDEDNEFEKAYAREQSAKVSASTTSHSHTNSL